MPCDYRIDTTLGVVFSRAFGVLTEEDLTAHRRRLAADPAFDPGYAQLFDFSAVTSAHVTPAYFQQRVAAGEIFGDTAKRAFVTPQDAVYGSARAFHAWLGNRPNNIRIFRDAGEARRWLGLAPD